MFGCVIEIFVEFLILWVIWLLVVVVLFVKCAGCKFGSAKRFSDGLFF